MGTAEQQALDDIARYGCHVIHVMEEQSLPPFSYSVGIQRSSEAPELIVVGLHQSVAHTLVNTYNDKVRAGQRFRPGQTSSDFLEGFDCVFDRVAPSYYPEYLGWNLWLYEGPRFEVLQLIYPSRDGLWPWQSQVSAEFRALQPVLTLHGASDVAH